MISSTRRNISYITLRFIFKTTFSSKFSTYNLIFCWHVPIDNNITNSILWTKFFSKLVWREIFQTSYIFFFFFSGVDVENPTIKFHISYVFNMYIKFHSNRKLFAIWSINLFFIYNFRSQQLEIFTLVWKHNNWSLIFLKCCKHEEYNKNMQSNS